MSAVNLTISADKIATVTLDNPSALNAMDEKMAEAFKTRISELKNNDLRVVILTGQGKAFSAGGDLDMLLAKSKLSAEENKRKMLQFYDSFLCIRDLGVPIIAAVNGHAIGAGFCLALAADIRVISSSAKCGLTFTRLGLHPGMGATYFLPRVAGLACAFELLLTGKIISGDELVRYNLTNHLVEPEQVLLRANEIAEQIILSAPDATKQLLKSLRNYKNTLAESLDRESDCQAENYGSLEFIEGVTATIEKRLARY